jgi:hypothetical protein
MEAVMRHFSWPGITALACAAGSGFLAGEAVHRHDAAVIQICEASGELSDAPPTRLSPPQPVEEIDLTCPQSLSAAYGPQSMEPPLAEGLSAPIRTVNFEVPAGSPIGPELPPFMPYLTDDGAPAQLPPLGDVPLLVPPIPVTPQLPDPANPIFQAAKKFVAEAARLPEVTDKVPLGKPPVSEHPSAATPNKP